ncbi:MAG TPA: hypothetical protein VFT62_06940 [Mycobacteriales bacterium]|nr:hypothetical protein [Mycobacteriales bacterium]
MRRQATVGASAAALLPAALAAAVLVSAPFAGTTTAPLAHDRPLPAANAPHGSDLAGAPRSGAVVKQPATGSTVTPERSDHASGHGLGVLAAAELGFVGIGAGVLVRTRRRRQAEG